MKKARPVVSPRGNMTMWTIPMEVKHTQNMTFFTPINFLGRVERFLSAPTNIADLEFSE
jgi:hypothetical protein